MSDIKVSVFGPCNRPHLWEYFYENLAMNTVDFEIVFVGNVRPNFKLPDNFKFIYANVNPVQCEFIAELNCSGEILLQTPDDAHYSPFCLDMMYETYKKENDYKCMVAPMKFGAVINSVDNAEDILDIVNAAPNQEGNKDSMFQNIQLCVGNTVSKKFWAELGGPDKRFVFGQALTDVILRGVKAGGRIVFCPDTYFLERKDLCDANWLNAHGILYTPAGHQLMMYEWVENGKVKDHRSDAVQPFEINDTLLTVSQGPKGEWD